MVRKAPLAMLASCVGLLALVPAAWAASTVSVGTPLQLVNKLYVDAPVTYSCPVITPLLSSGVNVSLEQAVNKSIAQGFGSITPICDGATHTGVVAVYPSVSGYTSTGVPFKTGEAVASSTIYDCGQDPNNSWNEICDQASSDSVTVKISSGKS